MKRKELVLAILLVAGSMATPAYATPNYIYTATVSGATASGPDKEPENATARFVFNSTFTSLSLTLSNTAGSGQLGAIASVLDGISFVLGGVSASALSLTSLSDPGGTIACAKQAQTSLCTFDDTPVDLSTSGWTYKAADTLLSAGNGSYKPYGIVNGKITATDGIPNDEHNPYLNGPVSFEFVITNAAHNALTLDSAKLYFGTKPDIQTAIITSVPEPESYAMLLAGLSLIGTLVHRRRDWRPR